ncbi:MAG: radical SAM protein [Candidatus Omnitrophica bacterium]|nr:radical SAM protein [Candidatus Omnitrophota bacterium]
MKIVLANLSGVQKLSDGRIRHFVKAGSRWPMTIGYAKHVDYYPFPFYLAYATALLKKTFGPADVEGIDGVANDYDEEELFKEIEKRRPEIFIAEVTLITLKDDLAFIKKVKDKLQCVVIVVGVYVSSFQEKVLESNPSIDYAIYGEYELSLKELVDGIITKRDLKQIPGIILRDKGAIVKHPQRAAISDLNLLPFPDRKNFPISMYADFSMHFPCVSIMASRGCPAGCVYCVERHVTYASGKYRMRDYRSVVDEMEECKRSYGAKQFYFDDQSFVVNKEYVTKLCEEMKRRNLNVPWTCMGDAMFLDYETLKMMAAAGCIGMKFGVESANAEILKGIHKPLNVEKSKEVARWCRNLGIMTHATFCIGLPDETEETIQETIDLIKNLDVDSAQVSKAVPYPGTPFYDWAKSKGYLVTNDLDLYDGMAKSVLSYPNLPAARIDFWYEKISKMVSRKKLLHYLKHPFSSISMIFYMFKKNGWKMSVQSMATFLKRSY